MDKVKKRNSKFGNKARKNEDDIAIALSYDIEKDNAPTVTAKGRGLIAEKILQTAHEHQISIHKDQDLAQLLSLVEIDQEIPVEAFSAVAEILSYLYQVNQKMSLNRGQTI